MGYRISWGPQATAFTLQTFSAVQALQDHDAFSRAGRDNIVIFHCEQGALDLAALTAAASAERAENLAPKGPDL